MNKRKPKRATTISFVTIYLFCLVLIGLRWIHIFNETVFVVNEEITSHITNFTLSVLLCLLIGYFLLSVGKKYRTNVIAGVLLVCANWIYEMWLPILNTTDPIDAVYGTVGVLISLVYLYFIGRYGFEG